MTTRDLAALTQKMRVAQKQSLVTRPTVESRVEQVKLEKAVDAVVDDVLDDQPPLTRRHIVYDDDDWELRRG